MENQNKNEDAPSAESAKTLFKMAVKNQKNSTYDRRKRIRKEAIKKAKRKYGLMVAVLLIIPSLFIGYHSHQLTLELEAVQAGVLSDTARLEAIRAQNEEIKQDNQLLATYEAELAQIGAMGEAIKKASLEFGQDAEEAVQLQGLMLGIANAESSMGVNFAVDYDRVNCHNWWGLKGGNMARRGDGSSLRCFVSDEAGARTMAKTLKLYYLNEGKDTPEKIVVKYVGAKWGIYHDQWVTNVQKYVQ